MKNRLLQLVGACGFLGASLLPAQLATAQTNSEPPTILTQPTNQTASYGADATFTVTASGADIKFQWRKNGTDLKDHGKIFGAQSSTLKILGAAQQDAGKYSVVVSNNGGAITSVVATVKMKGTVIFNEDFEAGDFKNWTSFSDKGSLSISDQQNYTTGGSRSAALTNSAQRMYHNLGQELTGRTKVTFHIYDDGSERALWLGEIRGYTGQGHTTYAPGGGLNQLFAIGCYGADFGTNNKGSLPGGMANLEKYQGRVLRGTNAGWFNLDAPGSPNRSVGWHEFEIERSDDGTTIEFKVDGVLGKKITQVNHYSLDCVVIGSLGTGDRFCSSWFDDVRVEGFPGKFDWESKDSEGEGLFDWMKLREIGVDPTISRITQIDTVFQAAGSEFAGSLGRWQREPGGAYALDMRGYVEYVVNVPTDDAYRIEIEGRERNFKQPSVELPLIVSIDGEYLGRFSLRYGKTTNGFVHCFTPFLPAGAHTIRIYWDNAESYCSLYVEAVRLQKLAGADLNGNGIKDWVENRLLTQCGIEVAPSNSLTSPVCIEGRERYLGMMTFQAGVDQALSPVPVYRAAAERWYANVPLSPAEETQIEVTFQSGHLIETRGIVWQVTDLLTAKDVTIRKGDSLLLNAVPDGATSGPVYISISNETNYTTDATVPVAHQFDQAGTFAVTGTFVRNSSSGSIQVKVVEAVLDASVATWVNKQRYWNCTNFSPEVVIDSDPGLKLERFNAPPSVGTNMSQYTLVNDSTEDRVILARLGRKGPILSSTAIKGFRLSNSSDTYLRLTERNRDGSQLIEAAYVLSPVLPEVTVGARILVSGVTFADGTVTKSFSASDFDELGICRVRFVRAAGVATSICHASKAYQGDIVIGWPSNLK